MTEIIYILMMVLGVGLFALGGTGFKWMRRFLMPIALGGCLYYLGVNIIQVIISMGILCGAMCLGYGQNFPWWVKFLVGCSYMAPSLVIGFSLWVFIVPVVFIVLFLLSNWQETEKSFTWKIVECAFGFIISASLIAAHCNQWSI